MDEEEDKKDEDAAIPDAALDDVLAEETEDDELAEIDPLSVADPFGGDGEALEKQWE